MDLRIKLTDPNMTIVGYDVGGGEIYHYKGSPFTGILEYSFFPNGCLQTELQCVDGYPQGFEKNYHENGQIMEESFTKRNLLYGPFSEWDKHGGLIAQSDNGPEPMLVLAIDVHYRESNAKAVGVVFDPAAEKAPIIITDYLTNVAEYVPGEFYKRELPCILKIIEKSDLTVIDFILIDGYVYVDNEQEFGLGSRLWQSINGAKPIIGVAKTSFAGNYKTVQQIKRGESENPLYISAIGVDLNYAAQLVTNMKGSFRIPDILKTLDRITKEP